MKGSKTPAKTKDLAPKSGSKVKGGGRRLNDSVTLLRAAKPTVKKDLPAKKDVKGGLKYSGNDNITLLRHAKPAVKKKDLPAKKDVKGGKKSN